MRSSFSTFCETVLKCNGTALSMYMGQSRGSIRDAHCTARDIEFLKKEIVEKIDNYCVGTMDKTMDNCFEPEGLAENTTIAKSLKMSAGSGNRTRTARCANRGILSPLCLPIPPSRHALASTKSLGLPAGSVSKNRGKKKFGGDERIRTAE